jgi:hypothetical protein
VRGTPGEDESAADLAAFGIPPEQAQAWTGRRDDHFQVWPENARAVRCFLALETQWRYLVGAHAAVAQGLDYAAVEPALRMMGVKRADQAALFSDLRMMERSALEAMSERQ